MKRNQIKYEGTLKVTDDLSLPCYVLEDGTRVLSSRGMQNSLKIGTPSDKDKTEEQKSGVELSRFLTSKWFKDLIINKYGLEHFSPITCYKGNQKINGYEATTLIDFCGVMLEARESGELKTDRQLLVAAQCEILTRAFAKVGIIALVDEATGYQYEREKDELQHILKAYIAAELLPWQKRFPDDFYKEIFRLNGWDYTVNGIKQRPGVIGTWTKKLIYHQLPKGVLKELYEKTPRTTTGKLAARLHQSLTTDIGNPHLEKQLVSVITLMNISKDWREFLRFFNKKFGQQELDFNEIEELPPSIPKNKFDQQLKGLLKVPPPNKDK